MTKLEDFIIYEPYQPTVNEKQAIAELEADGLEAKNWDSAKVYIKSFKKNLREDMYIKQNKLCAYCRIHVPLACVPMHCEHIVYKDKHPQWMFLPENLCIACPTCNTSKGETEVLMNPGTKSYPNNSEGFRIIHPLYDKYSEHIELIGGVLYHGITTKGIFTVKTCNLARVDLAEERADQMMLSENDGSVIAELLRLLAVSENYVDDNAKFEKYVNNTIDEYKQKHANGN